MFTPGSFSTPSNKGKKIVTEDVVNMSSGDEEETKQWMHRLLRTKFWEQCEEHWEENRGEMTLFCLRCYEVICPHCTHNEPAHRLLKVYRYIHRSVVLVRDMQDLHVDVSRIQTYPVSSLKGVHLRPMRRSPLFEPRPGTPRCLTCFCWLRDAPNLFCSITCKEKADVSPDDFSGPEAERRHREQLEAIVLDSSTWQPSPPPSDASPLSILAETSCQISQEPSVEPPVVDEHHHKPEAEAKHSYRHKVVLALEAPSHQRPRAPQPPNDAPPATMADQRRHPGECPAGRKRPRKQATPRRAPFF